MTNTLSAQLKEVVDKALWDIYDVGGIDFEDREETQAFIQEILAAQLDAIIEEMLAQTLHVDKRNSTYAHNKIWNTALLSCIVQIQEARKELNGSNSTELESNQ